MCQIHWTRNPNNPMTSSFCCQPERLNVSNLLPGCDVITGPQLTPESARPRLRYPESLLVSDWFCTIRCFHSCLHYITLFIFPVRGPNISRQLNNPPRSLQPPCVCTYAACVRLTAARGGGRTTWHPDVEPEVLPEQRLSFPTVQTERKETLQDSFCCISDKDGW